MNESSEMPIATEPFRPLYHYTPRRNFMNDPNGLIFVDGQFLLFHQFNPNGNGWGHMSWKQAASSDLIHWTHLPVALHEEEGMMAFSGSMVLDKNNTSGFGIPGVPPLVAIFTGHRVEDRMECPCLAYSQDRGRTWSKFVGNPVLPAELNFRDPKVFWHEATRQWVMLIVKAVEKTIRFYRSSNLLSWQFLSTFGPEGAPAETLSNWECPDLFRLPIEGKPDQFRWVLHVGIGDGHPNGGSGGQYFVGNFDGTHFTNDNPHDLVLWSDYGKDNYAAITWADIAGPGGEAYWIGWMCNWRYAEQVPTHPWRNGLTLPRLLSLRPTRHGLRLVQKPVPQLMNLRRESRRYESLALKAFETRNVEDLAGQALEIEAEFEIGTSAECGLAVRAGDNEQTLIGIDNARQQIFVDRSHTRTTVPEHFAGRHTAPAGERQGRIRFHIFIDSGSVEVFTHDGQLVLTELIFPQATSQSIRAYALGGDALLVQLTIWTLDAAPSNYCDVETSQDE